MRIAKLLLTVSLSVFLLAVSWSLLTGQLGLPGPAHAQSAGEPYSGPPIVYFSMQGFSASAIDEEGYAWVHNPGFDIWERSDYAYFVPGTPIPTGAQIGLASWCGAW